VSTLAARNKAEALVKRLRISNPPVPVDRIAQELGLSVVYMNLGADVSGLLFSNGDSSCIAVQEGDHPNRRRFTIAHEIGHHYLRHQFEAGEHVHVDHGNYISHRGPRSSTGVDPKEIEANQFAATLLMPSEMILRKVAAIRSEHLLDYHVSQLAESFGVSEQAMTIRLSGLGLL